ncbi:MAG: HIT family protein [Planctomycetes bacterium]|nr:HIT family protein [Planctomycetota bacterium]MCH8118817.1 HIT family protein [Planctomycetota bacterium]
MSADDCLFCKMVAGQIPVTKIYEDEVVLAFLDIGPISDGHTLVIPKQHFEKLHDCPPELLGRVGSQLGKIAGAVTAAMNSDGYNVLCNNGRAAGQLIEHLHFHIIPRNTGDGVFDRWPAYKYEQGKIELIAKEIRKKL